MEDALASPGHGGGTCGSALDDHEEEDGLWPARAEIDGAVGLRRCARMWRSYGCRELSWGTMTAANLADERSCAGGDGKKKKTNGGRLRGIRMRARFLDDPALACERHRSSCVPEACEAVKTSGGWLTDGDTAKQAATGLLFTD